MPRPDLRRWLAILLAACLAPAHAAPLVFHYPDSGAPPFLSLEPGASRPTGLLDDLLTRVARRTGQEVRYAFQPRESAGDSLRSGSADGALFFSVTRPAPAGVTTSEPLLEMDLLLVTTATRPLAYRRVADLAGRRLCTLTDEQYPPLMLMKAVDRLEMRAKTEQASLMMLRDDRCAAAVLNGPMFRWLARRYQWQDLRAEERPLLRESLVVGFRPAAAAFAGAFDTEIRRLRVNGELERLLSRHVPATERHSAQR